LMLTWRPPRLPEEAQNRRHTGEQHHAGVCHPASLKVEST
jgi:hypothetical protein